MLEMQRGRTCDLSWREHVGPLLSSGSADSLFDLCGLWTQYSITASTTEEAYLQPQPSHDMHMHGGPALKAHVAAHGFTHFE